MKFSFVIPVYKKKSEQFRKCLKSLVGQSHKDKEIIAVFDGPNDELLEVLKGFPSVKHVVIEHGGACKARNVGAAMATGDAIVPWDADCYAAPEMARTWEQYFNHYPQADFVYSGYRWSDPTIKGFDSEPFDPWTLKHYNYIASMFPCKRDKVVKWDESLKGLQDWDYWRRIVDGGAKGVYIPTGGVAYPFTTDLPDEDSISGPSAKREERIKVVREKFQDKKADILVVCQESNRLQALELAKALNADIFNNGFWQIEKYDTVIMAGLSTDNQEAADAVFKDDGSRHIVYWFYRDAMALFSGAPFRLLKMLKDNCETGKVRHICENEATRNVLKDLGFSADVLEFPMKVNTFDAAFPETFKVLAYADEVYAPLLQSLVKAMPDIPIDVVVPGQARRIQDYTVNLHLTEYKSLSQGLRLMLLAGRYVVSNIDEPHCGYISIEQDVEDFKRAVIKAIRALRGVKAPNAVAQYYYRQVTSAETFVKKLSEMVAGEVKDEVKTA